MRPCLFALTLLFALALLPLTIQGSAAWAESKIFDGVWEACQGQKGEQACIYYVLKQKDDRICGLWHYQATEEYDGRLIAESKGLSGRVTYTCARVGSETGIECADKAVPFSPSEWTKINKTLLICDGRLYALDGNGRSCADLGKSPGLPKLSSFTQPASKEDREWMNACLNDPAYPPPQLRK